MNPDHPEVYVVQLADTLWDISAVFRCDPWLWPEIWQINSQAADPHLRRRLIATSLASYLGIGGNIDRFGALGIGASKPCWHAAASIKIHKDSFCRLFLEYSGLRG